MSLLHCFPAILQLPPEFLPQFAVFAEEGVEQRAGSSVGSIGLRARDKRPGGFAQAALAFERYAEVLVRVVSPGVDLNRGTAIGLGLSEFT